MIWGRIADIALKHGKMKMVVEITYILFGILNLVCSFLHTFPLLLVYMALIGIVEGVWWVSYSLFAMEITGGYCYNEALSLLNLTAAFASLLGSPASGELKLHVCFSSLLFPNIYLSFSRGEKRFQKGL